MNRQAGGAIWEVGIVVSPVHSESARNAKLPQILLEGDGSFGGFSDYINAKRGPDG